jgi:predicted molibdopterin-dependent oxidoreductase YjgC
VEKITGVPAKDLVEAARLYAQSPNSSILYAMGITQHAHGTNNVLALANLAMMTGQIGKPSSGVNPLRGQNNVQGACDLGGLPNVYSGYQRVDDPAVRQKFEKAWGVSLPAKPGTYTNTERRVQRVRKAIDPIGDARPDWQILCDLASRLGYPMEYESPATIMEEVASLTPSYGGIHYDRLEGLGLQWPCPTPDHPGTQYLHRGQFTRGRGKFHVTPYGEPPELPDEAYPFLLTTGRVLYHYHTMISRKSKGLSEIYPEGVVEINPEDARRLGIRPDNGLVEIASRRGKVHAKARITETVSPGLVFMTFHFREAAVNLLTIDALDPIAKIPEFKVCAVKIRKV